MMAIARTFQPDAIVSHSFEGGHIDHDACFVLAVHVAQILHLNCFEFPLYWKDENGHDVFQEFRNPKGEEILLEPSVTEMAIKKKMLAEYKTQRDMLTVFSSAEERFRPARLPAGARPAWRSRYPGNWRSWRDTKSAFRHFSEFLKNARCADCGASIMKVRA